MVILNKFVVYCLTYSFSTWLFHVSQTESFVLCIYDDVLYISQVDSSFLSLKYPVQINIEHVNKLKNTKKTRIDDIT